MTLLFRGYIVNLRQETPARRQMNADLACLNCKHYSGCEDALRAGKMPPACRVSQIVGDMRFKTMSQNRRVTQNAYIHTFTIDGNTLDFDVIEDVILARMARQSVRG